MEMGKQNERERGDERDKERRVIKGDMGTEKKRVREQWDIERRIRREQWRKNR